MTGADIGTIAARLASGFSDSIVGRIPTRQKKLFLTIDDGPTDGTMRLIHLLNDHGVESTWFLLGEAAKRSRRSVWRIADSGHSIGNHSYRHLDAWRVRWMDVETDLDRGLAEIEEITGGECHWTRPPFGRIRPRMLDWCRARNQTPLLWDVMAPDFGPNLHPSTVAEYVRSKVRPGSIVVMHDRNRALQRRTFEMTISALLLDGWLLTGLPIKD